MQILADMQTMEEKFGSLKGLRMAYVFLLSAVYIHAGD